MAGHFPEAARYRVCASRRACIRSRSCNKNPRGFALSKSEKCTSHADDERITERSSVGNSHIFSRCEPEIDQPIAVLLRAFEALDAA